MVIIEGQLLCQSFPSTLEAHFLPTLIPGSTPFCHFHTGKTEEEETITGTIFRHVSQARPPLNLPHFTSFVIQITSWIFHSPRSDGWKKGGRERKRGWSRRRHERVIIFNVARFLVIVMTCVATSEARASVYWRHTVQPKNPVCESVCVLLCLNKSFIPHFTSFCPLKAGLFFLLFFPPLSVFCNLRRNL